MSWRKYLESYASIAIELDSAISQSDLQQLNFDSIFGLSDSQKLTQLLDDPSFNELLLNKQLKPSILYDTRNFASLLKESISFCFIYPKQATDLDKPIYVLIERDEIIKCYYVTDNILKFFDRLSNRTIKIIDLTENSENLYKTTNAGENWSKISSEKSDNNLPNNIRADDLIEMIQSGNVKIELV